MKDDDSLPTSTSAAAATVTTATNAKKENLDPNIFGKGRYKFWALAAILLLAFWSMFTGIVTLRLSAGNLNSLSDDLDPPIRNDLDVLEMEEREKVVKHMWDVYTNSRRIILPRFWQEAFEAAYEELTSDVPGIKDAAISEIAKMSVRSIVLDLPAIQSTLLGRSSGFQVDSSYKPCTKGLWLWSAPLKRTALDGTEYNLLLLDSEGIDAYDQTGTYSTKIFSLAILLSSMFIYNQVNNDDASHDSMENDN